MPLVDLDAIPQVELAFMNQDHRQEGDLLNRAGDALEGFRSGRGTKDEVLSHLAALDRHTREHFGREEERMRKAGFPPAPLHAGEHARALAEMEAEVAAFQGSGDAARLGRYLAETVPAWFVNQILTMDQNHRPVRGDARRVNGRTPHEEAAGRRA